MREGHNSTRCTILRGKSFLPSIIVVQSSRDWVADTYHVELFDVPVWPQLRMSSPLVLGTRAGTYNIAFVIVAIEHFAPDVLAKVAGDGGKGAACFELFV